MRTCLVVASLLWALAMFGCASGVRNPRPIPGVTAAQLVGAQNARVARLDRLWARASVQVTSTSDKGKRLRDQGEGHLQIVRPSSIALTLGKLGKTQLYLGSNEEIYWWIDLVDPGEKLALFGRHGMTTLDKAALLGVPVYPRDLVHLLGMTPLPDDAAGQPIAWDAQSRAALDAPAHSGRRRVWFDARTQEPVRVEIFDAEQVLVLTADLERYDYVTVVGDATAKPRIPEQITIRIVADGTIVKISLYGTENRSIRPTAFDFERLVKGYGVDVIYDLDAQTSPPGESP